ncbi:MAG TPA: peptidoglycan-binding protein [Candidatus Aphodomonas merdavium]|nr:peptidoglycan-binding protein [Candidatus Aphodomonas merdavium]
MKKKGRYTGCAAWLKRAALAGMIAAVLFVAGGCVKPDPTDTQNTAEVTLLPFATITPSPTPAATDERWQIWGGDGTYTPPIPTTGAEATAGATATIQVITLAPTSKPVWTIKPIATTPPTAAPSPTVDSTLRKGASGVLVRALQQKLQALGYYTGEIDGDFGEGTEEAVKAFQTQNGLKADGVVGSATQALLDSGTAVSAPSPTATFGFIYATSRPTPLTYTPSTLSTYRYLQMGSTGSDVTRMQQRLKDLGYFTGSTTGTFGETTQSAVIAFQERNGLWVDGVAGEDTQRMLYSSAALPFGGVALVTASPQATAYQTLKSGSSGAAVSALQIRLSELYYYTGEITGIYDDVTALAVRVFQQRNGLSVDGVAGNDTQSALYAQTALSAPTAMPASTGSLKSGSTGTEVYKLQEALYDLGYYTGSIDGIYGDEVETAVKAFQKNNGLTQDGKAGRDTQNLLYGGEAVAAGTADAVYSTLRAGDSGERVSALQVLLKNYGYYSGTITGTYDNATVLAVQQLQANNALMVDGVAGPATLMLLYAGSPVPMGTVQTTQSPNYTTLREGSSGPDVERMQEFLADLGYYTGTIDGEYGYTTQLAVTAFQNRNGLKADGVAGADTLALLYSGNSLAAAYATSSPRSTLTLGDTGADVYALQTRLVGLGFLGVAPDGVYSESTASGVRLFQQANGLPVDGVAGETTLSVLYGASVVAAQTQQTTLTAVDNRSRELEEQNAGGAIQASLSGGGVAASYDGKLYYTGEGGAIYAGNAYGSGTLLCDLPARFLHASSNGLTFVSGNQIFHASLDGGTVVPLVQVGSVAKMSLINGTIYYLEGSTLMKLPSVGNATVLASDANDFIIDIYDYQAYLATNSGIKRIGLNGSGLQTLVTTPADQVALADTVVFFRSNGGIYRLENGISRLLIDPNASWFAVYRDQVYYISDGCLYCCGTDGTGNQVFYDGQTSGVSFVAGKVYITAEEGGALTKVLDCK